MISARGTALASVPVAPALGFSGIASRALAHRAVRTLAVAFLVLRGSGRPV
jgi:hypothetical protein